jgi:hypothetical protein
MSDRVDVVIWPDPIRINVSGTPAGLEQLARLTEMGESTRVSLDCESFSPSISSSRPCFTHLEVRVTAGLLVVSAAGSTVVLTGSPEVLGCLSRDIRTLYESPYLQETLETLGNEASRFPGFTHLHIEYYSEGDFIAPESEPLLVYMRGGDH